MTAVEEPYLTTSEDQFKQELHDLFKELERFVVIQKRHPSQSSQNKEVLSKGEKFSLIGSLFFLLSLSLSGKFLSDSQNILSTLLVILSLLGFVIFSVILLVLLTSRLRTSKNIPQQVVIQVKKDALSEQKLARKIKKTASKPALRYTSLRFKLLIEEKQHREKFAANLLFVVAFMIAIWTLYIFGVPAPELNNFYYAVPGVIGIITIVLLLTKILFELDSQDLIIYQRCLAILEEAQSITDNMPNSQSEMSTGIVKVNQPNQ